MSTDCKTTLLDPTAENPPEHARPRGVDPVTSGVERCLTGIQITDFVDDGVILDWLFTCPAQPGDGQRVSDAILAGSVEGLSGLALRPVPESMRVRDSWPDVTPAVDLLALGGGRKEVCSVLASAVRNDKPRTVRVCHGVAGMGATARLWLAGRELGHGELVRLDPGLYPVVVEADHGRDGTWVPLRISRMAMRFTEVTPVEIERMHAWRMSLWQATREAEAADEAALLAQVRIDPATIRGRQGFFRVGRSVNGRWWLLDPDGKPFYHRGCTGLNAGGTGGRRVGNPPVPEARIVEWLGLLRRWRFNAMGAWTTKEFFDRGTPYAETIEGFYVEPWLKTKFPDVFDPRWAANIDEVCRTLCAPLRASRELIGYFLENERGFMEVVRPGVRMVPRSPTYRYAGPIEEAALDLAAEPKLDVNGVGLLQFCLSLPPGVPAGERAWAFVLERHGSPDSLGQAWGIARGGREAVRAMTASEEILISRAYLRDLSDFVRLWAEQYYRVFVEAVRRHDPNHLVLGMRHGGVPALEVLEVESRWTDVVSQNNYRVEFYENFDRTYRMCRKPILNGEFSTDTDSYTVSRNPIEPPGGYDELMRQEVRARQSLDRICTHPGVVGITKYRWNGSRWGDDKLWIVDRPQPEMALPLMRVNARAVPLAVGSDRPALPDDGAPTGQVFLSLDGGTASRHVLPAARKGGVDGERIQCGALHVGMLCRDGAWEPTVYGDGIRGTLRKAVLRDGTWKLAFAVKIVPDLFGRAPAEADYAVEMRRDGDRFEGSFSGHYNGLPVEGVALAFIACPVPTARL